jgi:hypothetical protein
MERGPEDAQDAVITTNPDCPITHITLDRELNVDFSKTEFDNLPIVSIKIEQGRPCLNPYFIPGTPGTGYGAEVMFERTGCGADGPDPRYTKLDYETNEKEI